MKVLVTGHKGYIGSVLVEQLLKEGYEVTGLDIDYYKDCFIYQPSYEIPEMIKDVRDITPEDLKGIEAIIHLAALSNDPLGEFNTSLTESINLNATLDLAECAIQAGVQRFVYASSQSMYGISQTTGELEEDLSEKNPVTAYARTKWEAECALKKLLKDKICLSCFRPSTVFGASPKLRCDIVYNNLVAGAYTTGDITILSDGTPWRPVVHVRDVCQAFIAGLKAPETLVNGRSYNVGIPNGNFTVSQLAEAAHECVPGSKLVITGEHGSDSRTYRVSFDRILTELKDYYQPAWDLERGGRELVDLFSSIGFTYEQFKGRACNRLPQLKYICDQKQVDAQLRRLT